MAKGSYVTWLIFTIVAVMFSMASALESTMLRYIYFIVAVLACYAIRFKGGEKHSKDNR